MTDALAVGVTMKVATAERPATTPPELNSPCRGLAGGAMGSLLPENTIVVDESYDLG